MRVGSLIGGISALTERVLLSAFPYMRTQWEVSVYNTGESSPELHYAATLISELQLSELGEVNVCCL